MFQPLSTITFNSANSSTLLFAPSLPCLLCAFAALIYPFLPFFSRSLPFLSLFILLSLPPTAAETTMHSCVQNYGLVFILAQPTVQQLFLLNLNLHTSSFCLTSCSLLVPTSYTLLPSTNSLLLLNSPLCLLPCHHSTHPPVR